MNSFIPSGKPFGAGAAIRLLNGMKVNPVPGPNTNTLIIKSLGFSLTEPCHIVQKSPPCVLRAVLDFQENMWIIIKR